MRRQARQRRACIVEAAFHLFARQGFQATTILQISRQTGSTEGVIYGYFSSKLGLLMEVVKQCTFIGNSLAVLQGARDQPALEVMAAIARHFISLTPAEIDLLRVMLQEAQAREKLHQVQQELLAEVIGELVRYLQERVAAGELRADLPLETSATAFLGAFVMFLITHPQLETPAWPLQAETFAQEWIDTWYHSARQL